MNNDMKNQKSLDDAISAVRRDEASADMMQAASHRVWNKLSGENTVLGPAHIASCDDIRLLLPAMRAAQLSVERKMLVEDHLHECVSCRHAYQSERIVLATVWKQGNDSSPRKSLWNRQRVAIAAAVGLLMIISAGGFQYFFAPLPGDRARLQSVTGSVYLLAANTERPLLPSVALKEGDVVRTGAGDHAVIRLFDGSTVEMNERSEFSITARRRATTIHLTRGRIIVQAVKQHGHLYVATDTAKVSVTGTVFAVDSGMKGTRVAVIEGEVHVDDSSGESVLHSGDQVSTSSALGEVPIEEEISWSQNREQHLALLAEFSKLQKKFATIPSPALRYDSAILPIVPENTLIYASVPNYGEEIAEANRMFQDELRDSDLLRQWWKQNNLGKDQARFQQMIDRIQTLGKYLGNEVVFMLVPSNDHRGVAMVAAAQVMQPGLCEYLKGEIDNSGAGPSAKSKIVILNDAQAANTIAPPGSISIMAGSKWLIASSDGQVLHALASGVSTGFAASPFGQAIAASYQEGAGQLFAANVEQVIMTEQQRRAAAGRPAKNSAVLVQSGFGQAQFLIAKRREQNGNADNRAMLSFSAQRTGLASWLAAPSPLGSMDFISPDASVAAAATFKAPAQMVDDVLALMQAKGEDPADKMAEFRSKMNVDLRDDLAAALGNDFAFAQDGPLLPTPSWKYVVEVNDQNRLQSALQRVIQYANSEAQQKGRPSMTMEQNESGGRVFYSVKRSGTVPVEIDYTYASGYLVAAPTQALVLQAIQVHDSRVTLARSRGFTSLLPHDQHANASAIFYQNLASLAAPLAQEMNPNEAQSFQTITANATPSLLVAYGDNDAIEVATTSKYFGFDINNLALAQLLRFSGTRKGVSAY